MSKKESAAITQVVINHETYELVTACPECGHDVEAYNSYCARCNYQLYRHHYRCPGCDRGILLNALFRYCAVCGGATPLSPEVSGIERWPVTLAEKKAISRSTGLSLPTVNVVVAFLELYANPKPIDKAPCHSSGVAADSTSRKSPALQ